jgi:hypothetical protein
MKIFIPKNLTNIEIISQLKKMIDGYEDYYEETSNPFDNYYYYLKNDDVKRFISLCLDETKIDSSQEYSEVLNYICRLFYSVKGTPLVFDYIEKYLGIKLNNIVYTTETISFEIEKVETYNINTFINSFKNFLNALLYYGDLKSSIEMINLIIRGEIHSNVSTGIIRYKEFIIGENDIITEPNNDSET